MRSNGINLTTTLLHFPLSLSQLSPLSNLHYLIGIPPETILPSQPRSTSFPPTLLPQPIHSLCRSLFLHPHQVPSLLQLAFHQSQHQAHLHTNLLPQFIHPPFIHPLHSRNTPDPVVLPNLQPLLSLCQFQRIQTIKVGRRYTQHQNLHFQFT